MRALGCAVSILFERVEECGVMSPEVPGEEPTFLSELSARGAEGRRNERYTPRR